jgi:nucleoid-associated protein YgaU
MGIFDFVKNVGKKLGIGDDEEAPDADSLKKELDSHRLGTGDEKAVVAVGNTLGISKVETDGLTLKSEPVKEPKFHTVKKGDNLWKIAEANYGKGKGAKYTVIFEANKPMLSDPDKIYPGQVLRIPPLD